MIRNAESDASYRQTLPRHELYSTVVPNGLPVRRQNVACDACRGRKIRCNRQNGNVKCDNCTAKHLECTAHYVASLKPKRRRESSTNGHSNGNGNGNSNSHGHETRRDSRGSRSADDSESDLEAERRGLKLTRKRKSPEASGSSHRPSIAPRQGAPEDHAVPANPILAPTPYNQMVNLLRYLLSPHPVHHAEFGYDDRMIRACPSCKTWDGPPSEAHLRLSSHQEVIELASDLLETYFQIVHIRLPILDPIKFKARFSQATTHTEGPPPHILLSIVLAFGSLFSEHPIIVADREECSLAMQRELQRGQKQGVRQRCRISQMLILRAREVAEVNKSFRVPSVENIQASLLLDALMGDNITSPREYRACWFRIAIDHLKFLGLNKKATVVRIQDEQLRGCLVFAWWLACLGDAFASCYYRLKPSLDDNDYDVEQPTAPQGNPVAGQTLTPHPLGTLSEYIVWYSANHAQSSICRLFCKELWIPKVEAHGIPVATLTKLVSLISNWRDQHLSKVGVPTVWPSTWDFVAAVTSCSIDSNYHVMWVVLQHAIRDFGIRSEDRVMAQAILEQISTEALHGALRVAALASVLTANNYLRLDPNLLYFAVAEAASYLSSIGRDEATACIAGLRQYGILYEAAYAQADEYEARLLAEQARQHARALAPVPEPVFPIPERQFPPRELGGMVDSFIREPYSRGSFDSFTLGQDDGLRQQQHTFAAFPILPTRLQESQKDFFSDRR